MTRVAMLGVLAIAALVSAGSTRPSAAADTARARLRGQETIAYAVWYQAAPEPWLAGGGLCIVGGDGGPARRLTGPEFDASPSWSPDGSRLAFASAGNRAQPHGYDVFVLDVRSGRISGITTTDDWNELNRDPAWSPDGRSLALVSGWHDDYVLEYELESGGLTVVSGDQRAASPTWSPDGRRIAYTLANPLRTAVYETDLDGGVSRQLAEDGSHQLDYAPDGNRVAYVDSKGDIVVARADGSEPSPLRGTPEIESDPEWSPDGTRIVFARKLADGWELVVARADGGAEQAVVRSPFELSGPTWRPRGGFPTSRPCVRSGGPGADRLRGTAREDVILGGAGEDRIVGSGNRDSLDGGAGADVAAGGPGNDVVIGGPGADMLLGGEGRDSMWARDRARDDVRCGPGKDYVFADFKDISSADCEAVSRRSPS